MVEIARKNSERLVLLINDILDIEKIESGQMRFEMAAVPVVEMLKTSLDANRVYAQTLGVNLELDVLPNTSPHTKVWGDETRLLQVMANLISNAAKFSPAGASVRVTVQVINKAEGAGNARQNPGLGGNGGAPGESQGNAPARVAPRVRISVIDAGSGVPEDFLPRLFEKFAQADSSNTRSKGGTGLGLAIVKVITDKHGGTIKYRNDRNGGTGGSTFELELPMVRNNAEG
jgi:signal transduction histidine kinase